MKNIKVSFILLLGAMVLFMSGCSFSGEDAVIERQREELDDREKLKSSYKKLEGIYWGQVHRENRIEPIEYMLMLETLNFPNGVDSDGKERFNLILSGKLFVIDSLSVHSLHGTFYEDNNEFVLVNKENPNLFSIEDAQFDSSTSSITGVVREAGGELGSVVFNRRSTSTLAPTEGWGEFSIERRRCFLQNLVGTYSGEIQVAESYKRTGRNYYPNMSIEVVMADRDTLSVVRSLMTEDGTELDNLKAVYDAKYYPRNSSIELQSSHSRRINGRFNGRDTFYEMQISNQVGLVGSVNLVSTHKQAQANTCLQQKACTAKDWLCIRQCEKVCDDREFVLDFLQN